MAESVNIQKKKPTNAPTPQNTPSTGSMQTPLGHNRTANMETIPEDSSVKERPERSETGDSMIDKIQNRLYTLTGSAGGFVDSLPIVVQGRLAGLKAIQIQQNKIDAEFQREVLELERRYLEKYKPLYARRAQIVAGDLEPSKEEIEEGKNSEDLLPTSLGLAKMSFEGDTEESSSNKDKDDLVKGIPNFWLKAMKNMASLAEVITTKDEEALTYLKDVRMSYLEDSPGFKLEFDFAPNQFFNNQTLSKTYVYQAEAGYSGDFVYDHAEGDVIDWLENMDLTMKTELKKQRNKNTKQTRVITKQVPTDSFFNFFNPPQVKQLDNVSELADDSSEIETKLEIDYQLGEDIKEKLIPRALDWFTGAASLYEEFDSYENGGGYDIDDSGYEDNDFTHPDDDDDDSDVEARKLKRDSECNTQ